MIRSTRSRTTYGWGILSFLGDVGGTQPEKKASGLLITNFLCTAVSVCEHTVNLPTNVGSNREMTNSADIVHVINDLREVSCHKMPATREPPINSERTPVSATARM